MGSLDSGIIRSPEDINFLLIALIAIGSIAVVLTLDRLFSWLGRHLPLRVRPHVTPWGPVLRVAVILFGGIQISLLVLKPTTENLIAVAGATALGFSFALRDYLSGLIAGLVLVFERPYRIGDWISMGDTYGEVRSIGFRSTTLITPDDTLVVVPNSAIWSSNVKNSTSGHRTLQVVASFPVRREHDFGAARTALEDVAYTSAMADLSRPVVVTLTEERWFSVYRLKTYPRESSDQFAFLTDLYTRGRQALMRRKIESVDSAFPLDAASG